MIFLVLEHTGDEHGYLCAGDVGDAGIGFPDSKLFRVTQRAGRRDFTPPSSYGGTRRVGRRDSTLPPSPRDSLSLLNSDLAPPPQSTISRGHPGH